MSYRIGLLTRCLLVFAAAIPLTVPALAAPPDARLLVDLDARDSSAGTDSWLNHGALGPFTRIGHPTAGEIGGVRAVSFDGRQDAYRGPHSVPAIEGNA